LLDHHILCLASLFSTQVNPEVILWTDAQSYNNLKPLIKIFMAFNFTIKIGNFPEDTHYQMIAFRADKWRLEILKLFGGIYFDLDILFLKDISWFANYGPIVQQGYIEQNAFNNCILFFPKNHFGLIHWLDLIEKHGLNWSTLFTIHQISDKFGADMIPNYITEGGSHGISCDDFFDTVGLNPHSLENFIFFHWHNRYHTSVKNQGTVAHFFWKKFVVDNPLL
jgi:hypothetical protein